MLFGKHLRTARIQSGMTQEQLAEKIGVSLSFLSQMEHGKRYPSYDTLMAICSTLGASSDSLLFGEKVSGGRLNQILSDCTAEEGEFLLSLAEAAKHIFRRSRDAA